MVLIQIETASFSNYIGSAIVRHAYCGRTRESWLKKVRY